MVHSLKVNKTSVPAGCYHSWSSAGTLGYFNSVVNASLTDPSLFDRRGGVCRNKGSGTYKEWSNVNQDTKYLSNLTSILRLTNYLK